MVFNRILKYITRKKTLNDNLPLFTLGYEGIKLQEFISYLKEKRIKILIDVRKNPWSRKKGFSKSQLEKNLSQYSIKYIHMKRLGSPSVIRKKVKEDSDYNYFFSEYRKYIKTQSDELQTLLKTIEKSICCLMCYEKDVEFCHRKVIASEVKKIDNNGLEVVHI